MPQIKVGDYLFKRIHELGVRSVFGVPGDYELALLDLVQDNGLEWKGNANELVASYAADGYARVNGAGAFVTTFGPGELSAYCGMAGQYCEYVPVAHIVGYPSTQAAKAGAIMHHTLGNGKFDMFEQMSKHITAATIVLRDPTTATKDIDQALTTMIYESRPVYIGVPTDVALVPVSDDGLKTPIPRALPTNPREAEKSVIAKIRALLEGASNPAIIVDGGAARFDVVEETQNLVSCTNLPTFTTPMGKGSTNEELPNFAGVYGGMGSYPKVREAIESSDAILWVGRYSSDFNSGEFTIRVNENAVIDFQRFWIKIGNQRLDINMKHVLSALVEDIKLNPLKCPKRAVTWDPYPAEATPAKAALTQDFLWPTLGKFFRPGDLVIGETGTSAFGLGQARLPAGVMSFNQTVWGSIGYATGAAVGAFQAIKEGTKFQRGVLVTGEGSMHLTVQAFADLLRYELKPIIFVLNNGGYTVERLIHGKAAGYNDVAEWDYGRLAGAFGPGFTSRYHGPVRTSAELVTLLEGDALREDCFHLVELVLEKLDAPTLLLAVGAAVGEFNEGHPALGK